MNDTLSEVGDEKEKNAIFNHSMRHGVFNDLQNSPLKKKMPTGLQMYNPALEKRLFTREATKGRQAMDDMNRGGLDAAEINKDLLMASSMNHRF